MAFGARKAVPFLISIDFTNVCVHQAHDMVSVVAMRACTVNFQQ
jgi:hypothetical protein